MNKNHLINDLIKNLPKKFYSSKFVRFSVTGGLGTITNLIIFYLISDLLSFPSNIGAIISFVFAVTQNYFINHFWTFSQNNKTFKASVHYENIKGCQDNINSINKIYNIDSKNNIDYKNYNNKSGDNDIMFDKNNNDTVFNNNIRKVTFKSYFKFVAVSLVGFGINLIVLNLILYFFKFPLKVIAQGIGILAGLIFNYFGASKLVFKK